jgi:serine/threonine-protein kinase
MYEMTTGTLPFTADSPVSVALMQVNQAPVPPHELNQNIPVGLEQIILTSMEKQPELRFQNTTQMLRHIAQLKSNPGYTFKPRSQQGAHNYNAQYRRRPNVVTEKTLKTVVTGSIPKQGEISVMKKKPRKRNTSMLPIITGITAAFLLVAGAAAIYIITLFFNPSESEAAKSITIPNFIGQAYNETFEKDLTSTYYRIFVEPVYSEDYPPNTIIEQSPKAGEVRKVIQGKQFCDLSLTVSKGVQTIVLNDYTVMDYREVQNELRALGLVAETLPAEYSDTILQGYVIKTEPAAGTSVTVGDTVKLYVSKGQQIVEVIVPNFVGMTEEEARKALDESNLSLGDVKYVAAAEDQLAGVVIDQSIPAYREVPEKVTKIDFTITE